MLRIISDQFSVCPGLHAGDLLLCSDNVEFNADLSSLVLV